MTVDITNPALFHIEMGTCVYVVGCDSHVTPHVTPLETPPLITYVQTLDPVVQELLWEAIKVEVNDEADVNQAPFPAQPAPPARKFCFVQVFPRIQSAIRRWRAKALVGAVD